MSRAAELEPASVQKDALECYIRFATTPAVPRAAREPVLARLPEFVEAALVTDPEQWRHGGYGPWYRTDSPPLPLDRPVEQDRGYASSRHGGLSKPVALYAPFREHVDRHLDYVIETQGEDGAWSPHWNWMGPDVPGGLGAELGSPGRASSTPPSRKRLRPARTAFGALPFA